jgi:hypothetical protein
MPRRRPAHWTFPIARVTAVLSLAAWLLQRSGHRAELGQQLAPLPAVEHVPLWVTDVSPDAGPAPVGGRKIPLTPVSGQAKPPCTTPRAQAINGGCWVEIAGGAPCEDTYWEHGGKCYIPVQTKKPIPTSITP